MGLLEPERAGTEVRQVSQKHGYEPESFTSIRKRLGWRFHVRILAYVAVTASATLFWHPDYFWSISAVSAAIFMMLWRFWALSRRGWFWMVMAPMIILQVPLVIASNTTANRYRAEFCFLLSVIDFIVMNAVVTWISPKLWQHS